MNQYDNVISYRRYVEQNTLDFSTRPDEAVFFSGGTYNFATVKSAMEGKKTIAMTPGGAELHEQELYTRFGIDANEAWIPASERYAQMASGKVSVIGKEIQASSIFAIRELPILLSNKSVTHINGVPRFELLKLQEEKGKEQLLRKLEVGQKLLTWDGDKRAASNPSDVQSAQREQSSKQRREAETAANAAKQVDMKEAAQREQRRLTEVKQGYEQRIQQQKEHERAQEQNKERQREAQQKRPDTGPSY